MSVMREVPFHGTTMRMGLTDARSAWASVNEQTPAVVNRIPVYFDFSFELSPDGQVGGTRGIRFARDAVNWVQRAGTLQHAPGNTRSRVLEEAAAEIMHWIGQTPGVLEEAERSAAARAQARRERDVLEARERLAAAEARAGHTAQEGLPRTYAEAAARAWEAEREKQMAEVAAGRRERHRALDLLRRKYDDLHNEYFTREGWMRSERAWQEYGPARAWAALVATRAGHTEKARELWDFSVPPRPPPPAGELDMNEWGPAQRALLAELTRKAQDLARQDVAQDRKTYIGTPEQRDELLKRVGAPTQITAAWGQAQEMMNEYIQAASAARKARRKVRAAAVADVAEIEAQVRTLPEGPARTLLLYLFTERRDQFIGKMESALRLALDRAPAAETGATLDPLDQATQSGDAPTVLLFIPHNNSHRPVYGLLSERLRGPGGEGLHLLAPLPGDSSRIVRIWLKDGELVRKPNIDPSTEVLATLNAVQV